MKHQIPWHRTGLDPDCTALAIQLSSCGIELPGLGAEPDEAMLFGIGGGVGCGVFQFVYEKNDFSSFYLAGRTRWDDALGWHRAVIARLGLECEVFESGGKRAAAKTLSGWIGRGRPVVAWVDAGSLPYRGLGGFLEGGGYHTLTIYREEDGRFLLGDLAPDPVSIAADVLATARSRIRKHRNRLLQVAPGPVEVPVEELVWGGLEAGWQALQNPRMAGFSLAALQTWAQRLAGGGGKHAWPKAFPRGHRLFSGLSSITRFIESIDNDGCLHRRLMARFLAQAGQLLDEPELSELAGEYELLADSWRKLARAALPDEFEPLADLRRQLVHSRSAYFDLGPAAREQIEAAIGAVERFGDELEGGADFPVPEHQVPNLLAGLAEQVTEIAAAEIAAQEKIGRLLGERGRL